MHLTSLKTSKVEWSRSTLAACCDTQWNLQGLLALNAEEWPINIQMTNSVVVKIISVNANTNHNQDNTKILLLRTKT